tara:strand:+ start:2553 stop:2849 length:297 start_codon:yes stop_codon:yes gene_type:complete
VSGFVDQNTSCLSAELFADFEFAVAIKRLLFEDDFGIFPAVQSLAAYFVTERLAKSSGNFCRVGFLKGVGVAKSIKEKAVIQAVITFFLTVNSAASGD